MIARRALVIVSLAALAACGQPVATPTPGSTATVPAAGPTVTPTISPSISPSVAPSVAPSASATPPAAPTPTPTTAVPAGFACANASGGAASAGSAVTAVRVGSHAQDGGYDRFVIEFAGAIPAYRVTRQAGTGFEASPSSQPFSLDGTTGVVVWLQPVAEWTSYRSPTYFHPRYPYLREARLLENFEAVQQWALGVEGRGCIRVTTLTAPSRLVVDVTS